MKTTKTPLYRKARKTPPRHLMVITALVAVALPYHTLGNPTHRTEPYQQEFVITAYYSPLPGQCCYVKGGLEADRVLNGQGVQAADSTGVYPGMLAAPKSYPFGTRISLPGYGTFEVHDRGGAINELGNGKHRLDLWLGYGEEGLARALAFGVQRIQGTVYPVGHLQPEVQFDLADLPAPIDELKTYYVEKDNFLAMRPKVGDRGLSVYLLQDHLQTIGYLHHRPTGFFGPETKTAFDAFLADFRVDAPRDMLSETSAAYVLGARTRLGAKKPIGNFVDADAAPQTVMNAQRTLRFLGYYTGRTNGAYDDTTKDAIFRFQKDHGLVGDWSSNGAGRIGPMTEKAIDAEWNRMLVASHADTYLDLYTLEKRIEERGQRIAQFLGEGYYGTQVRLLQTELAALGFFPQDKINGSYGPLTVESVMAYQLDRGIISSKGDTGAGYVGPATLMSLRKDQRSILYKVVRANGWSAL